MLENIHGLQQPPQKNTAVMETTDKIPSCNSKTPEQQLYHSMRMERTDGRESDTFFKLKFILLLLFFKAAD